MAVTCDRVKRGAVGFVLLMAGALLSGCSDDGGSDRDIVRDPPDPPPPITTTIDVQLSALEVIGGGAASGGATASFTLNPGDLSVSGMVTLNGLTANEVTLSQGFAGESGSVLVSFTEDSATRWSLPADTAFTRADLDALNAGSLHVRVVTDSEPDGAVRGQLVVGDIQIIVSIMSGALEVPPVTTSAMAVAAITCDPGSGAIVVHINSVGLDDAVASHIHNALAGANGPVTVELVQDPDNLAHWFTEDATLDSDQMAILAEGGFYINLHTPANPPGEVRGQIVADRGCEHG